MRVLDSDRREDGFSLFELTIALVLILIVTMMSIPIFGSTSSLSRLRNSALKIAARLHQSKSRSITELSPYRLVLEAATNSWQLETRTNRTGPFASVARGSLERGIRFGMPPAANSAAGIEQCGGLSGLCAPLQASSIAFNTRGIPVDSLGRPSAQNAVYLTDGNYYYAVTVSMSGSVDVWQYSAPTNNWSRL